MYLLILFKLTCLYTQKRFLIGGFPDGSDGKKSACNAGDRVQSLGWEDFLEKEWQPTPVFLPGESQGQGSLVGCHLWGCTESDTTEVT